MTDRHRQTDRLFWKTKMKTKQMYLQYFLMKQLRLLASKDHTIVTQLLRHCGFQNQAVFPYSPPSCPTPPPCIIVTCSYFLLCSISVLGDVEQGGLIPFPVECLLHPSPCFLPGIIQVDDKSVYFDKSV